MNPKFVDFLSTDNLKLPGLLYESKKSKKVVIDLHGNGSSSVFYKKSLMDTLGKNFDDAGLSFFAFNNRGAHYIHRLSKVITETETEKVMGGMAVELIRDCICDIDGAVQFLKNEGYEEFILMGASTGANKICVYDYYSKKNPFSKYILLAGGDDTGLFYKMMGEKKFKKVLEKCRAMVSKHNGEKLMPFSYMKPYIMSYQSGLDILDPDGDYNIFPYMEVFENIPLSKKKLFKEFANITLPSLVVYGELDEYCSGPASRALQQLQKVTAQKNNFSFELVMGADHGFYGKSEELARTIARWISK